MWIWHLRGAGGDLMEEGVPGVQDPIGSGWCRATGLEIPIAKVDGILDFPIAEWCFLDSARAYSSTVLQ